MNVSVIVNRKFQYFPHPYGASLELRLPRHGITSANRQIVRRFEKPSSRPQRKGKKQVPWVIYFSNSVPMLRISMRL
jgi:hypothetical protein